MSIENFARASHQYDLRRNGTTGMWEDLAPEAQHDYLVEAELYLKMSRDDWPLWVKKILSGEKP